jgi:D-alanyl-D-alanine carboxypeptidase/D-alanyl-D-alanine-endopeptidase (penicillin-binding protein 4)
MLAEGEHRVSLRTADQSPIYFQQILSAKLKTAGIQVGKNYCDNDSIQYSPLFRYENSHTLQEVVTAMLKYSNNFIAQQLFLMLGAYSYQAPASIEKSQRMFDEYIEQHFQWQSYELLEGAGLSRQNQLSAHQIMDVLNRFNRYMNLLAEQDGVIRAKTGTLQGVRNYAGYLQQAEKWLPFVLIINQQVSFQFREGFIENLQRQLNLPK